MASPSPLQDNDLFLVNRGIKSYNTTTKDISNKVLEGITIIDQPGPLPGPGGEVIPPIDINLWRDGMLWYNINNGLLYIYYSNRFPGTANPGRWETVGGTDLSPESSPPVDPVRGDFDLTYDFQLRVWTGANGWVNLPYITGLPELP
jgi:hypothetical protein